MFSSLYDLSLEGKNVSFLYDFSFAKKNCFVAV